MIKLRQASKKDCKLIWKWANDPIARAMSFSTETFPYKDHVKWFESKLDDQDCYYYIAKNSNQGSVGQIRFDLKGKEAHISISLDRNFRGYGHGAQIIELACKTFLESTDAKTIHAYIKKENTASLAAFNKAGFSSVKSMPVKNQPAHHLILTREEVS